MLELLTPILVGIILGRAFGQRTDWEAKQAYLGLGIAMVLAIKMGMNQDVVIMGGASMLGGFRWVRGY